jgi:soluble lytic murein transglycosylase
MRIVLAGIAICFFWSSGAFADIYRYKDANGVWHFTNVKSDKRYKFYLKERPSPKGGLQFIKDYEHIISQASQRFSVERSLIKAVIKAESDFDHRAISSKGAQGLMQLMPETADEMDVSDAFNPEENIFGGTRYLGLMLERFSKDKRLALAAYNAGPERVEEYKGVPPFPETATFIERVLKYYHQYNAAKP